MGGFVRDGLFPFCVTAAAAWLVARSAPVNISVVVLVLAAAAGGTVLVATELVPRRMIVGMLGMIAAGIVGVLPDGFATAGTLGGVAAMAVVTVIHPLQARNREPLPPVQATTLGLAMLIMSLAVLVIVIVPMI